VPDDWQPGYPNPAFGRADERDQAWMARILARLSRPALEAIVASAELRSPTTARGLVEVLEGRKSKLLQRYLSVVSPLSDVRIEGLQLCARDLGVDAGVADVRSRRYEATAFVDDTALAHGRGLLTYDRHDGVVCAQLPPDTDATRARPAYVVIDLDVARGQTGPLRVHLYDFGASAGVRLVGIERPDPS